MNCVVCEKSIKKSKFTCSDSCAGRLSNSMRYLESNKKLFISSQKESIQDSIFKFADNLRRSSGYKDLQVLEFFGAGGMTKKFFDNDFDVTTVEKDKKLLYAMKKLKIIWYRDKITIRKNRIKLVNMDLKDYLSNNTPRLYDIVYLDFCGPFSDDKDHILKLIMKHNRAERFLLFLTFNACRTHFKAETKAFARTFGDILPVYLKSISKNKYDVKNLIQAKYRHGNQFLNFYALLCGFPCYINYLFDYHQLTIEQFEAKRKFKTANVDLIYSSDEI